MFFISYSIMLSILFVCKWFLMLFMVVWVCLSYLGKKFSESVCGMVNLMVFCFWFGSLLEFSCRWLMWLSRFCVWV